MFRISVVSDIVNDLILSVGRFDLNFIKTIIMSRQNECNLAVESPSKEFWCKTFPFFKFMTLLHQ